MLVLSRSSGESLFIGDNIKITVLRVNGRKVKIGIEAPKDVIVLRSELKNKEKSAEFTPVEDKK